MPKITISTASYNEIAAILEKAGVKINETPGTLTLEKGTVLEQPLDFRMVTIRRDCATIAAQAWKDVTKITDSDDPTQSYKFVDFTEEVYQYVLNGKSKPAVVSAWDDLAKTKD